MTADAFTGWLWASFFIAVCLLPGGAFIAKRHPVGGLLTLAVGLFVTLGFSFIAGLSIGRYTAGIAVAAIGYTAAMRRHPIIVVLCVMAAMIGYAAVSWILTPLSTAFGWTSQVPLGSWGIVAYAIIAAAVVGLQLHAQSSGITRGD